MIQKSNRHIFNNKSCMSKNSETHVHVVHTRGTAVLVLIHTSDVRCPRAMSKHSASWSKVSTWKTSQSTDQRFYHNVIKCNGLNVHSVRCNNCSCAKLSGECEASATYI